MTWTEGLFAGLALLEAVGLLIAVKWAVREADEARRWGEAVWREHVPVTGTMHDPANGLIHGSCVRCRQPWPCEWSPESPAALRSEGL